MDTITIESMLAVGSLVFVAVLGYFYVLISAKFNFIFTQVDEAGAKAIRRLGGFTRLIMSYTGYDFRINAEKYATSHNLPISEVIDEKNCTKIHEGVKPDPWDIVPILPNHIIKRRFGGLRLVGIPFMDEVYSYEFRWASLRQFVDAQAKPHDEKIDYILLQDDIYFMRMKDVEDKGVLTMNVNLLIVIRVVNPYKALFRVQEWLEMVQNRVATIVGKICGDYHYEEIKSMVQAYDPDLAKKSEEKLDQEENPAVRIWEKFAETGERRSLIEDYGVRIKTKGIRILNVDLTEESAKKYRDIVTLPYQQEQKLRGQEIEVKIQEKIAEGFKKVIDLGSEGMRLRELDVMEKFSQNSNLIVLGGASQGLGLGDIALAQQLTNPTKQPKDKEKS